MGRTLFSKACTILPYYRRQSFVESGKWEAIAVDSGKWEAIAVLQRARKVGFYNAKLCFTFG